MSGHLAAFAALILAPAILFSGFVIERLDRDLKVDAAIHLQHIASDVAGAVSGDLERAIGSLQMLSRSSSVDDHSLAELHDETGRAMAPLNRLVSLIEPDGRVLFDTMHPYGAVQGAYAHMEALAEAVARREPVVSSMRPGDDGHVDVVVPIVQGGVVRHALAMSLPGAEFASLIAGPLPASVRAAVILDQLGAVVATAGERPVGGVLAPSPASADKDDDPTTVFAPTRLGGWRVAIIADDARLQASGRAQVREVLLIGSALLVLTSGLIVAYGRQLSGAIHALAQAASGTQAPPATAVREVNEVGLVLASNTQELRASRDSLEAAMAVAGLVPWSWDRGCPITWPIAAKRIFGLAAEAEMTPDLFRDLLHPDDLERHSQAWAQAIDPDRNISYRLDYRIRRASDGAERWISEQATVELDSNGPLRIAGAMRDVTEHKLIDEAVRVHAAHQALLLEVTRALIAREQDEASLCIKLFKIIGEPIGVDVVVNHRIDYDCWALRLVCCHGAAQQAFAAAVALSEDRPEAAQSLGGDTLPDRALETAERVVADQAELCLSAVSCHLLFASDGRALGTYTFGSRTRDAFSQQERDFLQTVANFVALAWERIAARRQVEEREEHVRSILDNTLAFIGTLQPDGTLLDANAAALRAGRLLRSEVVGRKIWDCWWWSHDAAEVERLKEAVARVGRGEIVRHDATMRTAVDGRLTVDVMVSPVRDDAGQVKLLVLSGFDVTQRKQAETQIRLLLREVNHRAKNLLAVVQAIARHTARGSEPGEFVERLTQRIGGLAASQDLLVGSGWQGVPLRDLATSQLSHVADLMGSRVRIVGPTVRISAQAAQAIGMALHELATNSTKYGALSNDTGTVDISWGVDADEDESEDTEAGAVPTFRMAWVEYGGPPVSPPQRCGYGYTVTVRMAEHAVGGRVKLDHPATGLEWRLVAPVRRTLEAET